MLAFRVAAVRRFVLLLIFVLSSISRNGKITVRNVWHACTPVLFKALNLVAGQPVKDAIAIHKLLSPILSQQKKVRAILAKSQSR